MRLRHRTGCSPTRSCCTRHSHRMARTWCAACSSWPKISSAGAVTSKFGRPMRPSSRSARTLAITPGKVIYQNAVMQLIQYEPTTEQVLKRPLLIVPPWINKYYILDLSPEKSFVKWAVDQGQTVFLISWVNPDKELAHKSFEDYMREGILEALDAVEQATGERAIHALAYCVGGTLLAATLAYMAATRDNRVRSAT